MDGNHGSSLGWLCTWGRLHWIGDAFIFPSSAGVSIACFWGERLLPNPCLGWIASHAVSRRDRHEHLRFERISFLPVHDSVPFFDLSSHRIEQRRQSKKGNHLDYPGRSLEWCCLSDSAELEPLARRSFPVFVLGDGPVRPKDSLAKIARMGDMLRFVLRCDLLGDEPVVDSKLQYYGQICADDVASRSELG